MIKVNFPENFLYLQIESVRVACVENVCGAVCTDWNVKNKNMDALQRMPWLLKDAAFKKLASLADMAMLSKENRIKYDEALRKYRDTIAVLEGQYLEGMEKGMEKECH